MENKTGDNFNSFDNNTDNNKKNNGNIKIVNSDRIYWF